MLGAVTEFQRRTPDLDNNELVAALLARSETGLLALDQQGCVSVVNQAALTLLGIKVASRHEEVATMLERSSLLPLGSVKALLTWLRDGARDERTVALKDQRSLVLTRSQGPNGHLLVSLKPEPTAFIPTSRRDPLTGLADRTWFNDRLNAMLADPVAEPAVLMIDLDRFKAVNDSLGHPVGDQLLILVGKRLRNAVRAADVVCRFSGDEFSIIMPRAHGPLATAKRIVTALSRPYLIDGATVSIGASVGIAQSPEHGSDAGALVRAADVALYAAKGAGRGMARMFDAQLERTARARRAMAEELRKAIALNQLELHFQPQMMLDSGELTGFEAFVRWNHPELGMLMPDKFLSLAEESRLIWPIGEWVLQRACEEAITWPRHLSVAVNISAQQLVDRQRLPRMIKMILLKTGLAPERLEIDVPENALLQEADTLPVLSAIRDLGVRVSLDDFGTGYSSLTHLRRFPLDKLKIDRSFVQALGSSGEATDVVRAIAALGRTLGITTLAEGVETAAQQDRVRLDGYTEVQGYHLSKPVPAAEVGKLIAAHRSTTKV